MVIIYNTRVVLGLILRIVNDIGVSGNAAMGGWGAQTENKSNKF